MFSPNVWSFDPPNTLITHKYDDLNEKSMKNLTKRIYSHPFNKLINIVIPDVKAIPDSIGSLLLDTDHYIVKDLPLQELIRKPFIDGFVKQGQFCGLSVNTRIDVDDCIGVTPTGILHLSVTKDIYHYLGLEGKLSAFANKHPNRYSIQIDLKSKELANTTKFYERVRNALSNEILPKFTIRFVWTPPSTAPDVNPICPSSIAKYFSDLGHEVDLVQTSCNVHTQYGLQMPLLGPQTMEPVNIDGVEKFYATEQELIEYIGMLALSCDLESSEYLSSWKISGHSIEVGSAVVIRLKGMFSSDFVKVLFKRLREYVNGQSQIPWISLYRHGFPHAPVSFSNKEHSFGVNGDNSYLICLSPNEKYFYYDFLSSNKALK